MLPQRPQKEPLTVGASGGRELGSPDIAISGFDKIGLTPPLGRIDTTGHLNETLSFTTGLHQFRFGGEYRRSRGDVFYNRNGRGTFAYDGSQGPWANDATVSDNVKALADYLAGFVQSFTITLGLRSAPQGRGHSLEPALEKSRVTGHALRN